MVSGYDRTLVLRPQPVLGGGERILSERFNIGGCLDNNRAMNGHSSARSVARQEGLVSPRLHCCGGIGPGCPHHPRPSVRRRAKRPHMIGPP
jgi:hypothetical protein